MLSPNYEHKPSGSEKMLQTTSKMFYMTLFPLRRLHQSLLHHTSDPEAVHINSTRTRFSFIHNQLQQTHSAESDIVPFYCEVLINY